MQQVTVHPKLLIAVTDKDDGNIDDRFGSPRRVKETRKKIFEQLKLSATQLIEGEQTHEHRVLHIYSENAKMWKGNIVTGVDGFITDETDIFFMLRLADCVGVVLYDPEHRAVAVVHAGWRGAVKQIHLSALEKMSEAYDTDPKQVIAWLSPSASSCCYALDEKPKQADDKQWQDHIEEKDGAWRVDLSGYIVQTLRKEGVYAKNITVSDVCTVDDTSTFSAYRSKKTQEDQGRFGIIVKLLNK